MTAQALVKKAVEILKENNIDSANIDAYLLADELLGISRNDILLYPNKEILEEDKEKYLEAINKRATHIPLQHITGHQEFMGLDFIVNKDVLVPRFDTEILVEKALEYLKQKSGELEYLKQNSDELEVLDMCTGSGCIAISIDKYVDNARVCGVDISQKALNVARENNIKNQTAVEFVQSDLFENINKKYDLIISNPPYIETEEIKALDAEVRIYDPMLALDGHEDGLYFYRLIINNLKKYLKDNGKVMFEIGYNQSESVSELLKSNGFKNIETIKDLAGLDRVVIADN